MAEVSLGTWRPRSVWQGIAEAGRFGADTSSPGVRITLDKGGGAATVIAKPALRDALDAKIQEMFGIELPDTPRFVAAEGIELIWAGPDQWFGRSADRGLARKLAESLGEVAAVADQSGARAVLRISGPHARNALAKGCPIDLHPKAFSTGSAALTAIAHIGVQIWQLDETPSYNVAVFRSMAKSFWSWLSASSAEYGYEVRGDEMKLL